MLKTCIKHEFKATARVMGALMAGMLALALITKLSLVLLGSSANSGKSIPAFITGMLMGMTILASVALIFVVLAFMVWRFYKMLGDEGYLMFTLPVTPAELIGAKIIAATVWCLAVFAELAAILVLMLAGTGILEVLPQSWANAQAQLGTGVYGLFGLMLLGGIVGVAANLLLFYLSVAVGAQWPHSRLTASILSYLAISTGVQVLGTVLLGLSGTVMLQFKSFINSIEAMAEQMPVSLASSIFGIAILAAVVTGSICFFITRWLLDKKLNLA